MLDFHKFETVIRKPGGKVESNIHVIVRESITQAIITRYSDSPHMLGSTYYRFPYITTTGHVKFYLPTGRYDIHLSDGDRTRIFTDVQVGKLVGYEYEDLSDQGYSHWQKVLFTDDGFLSGNKVLTAERYVSNQTRYPATFLDSEGNPLTEMEVNHDINIQLLPGVYRILLTDDDGVIEFDHEEIGTFAGEEGDEAKCSLWQGIEW